jgi:hypothetical protein
MTYRKTVEVTDNLVSVKVLQDDYFICNIDFNKKELEKIGNRYENGHMALQACVLEREVFDMLYQAQNALGLTEFKLDTSS